MLREIGEDPLRVQRLDLAAQTLLAEVVARWGERILVEAIVKTECTETAVCDSHCPDSRGIDHALDFRVDFDGSGIGLSVDDGMWLAEYLRGVGRQTGRFSYLVHRGQIAGKFSGWRWGRYRGLAATMDRIHLSVCDVVKGEPSMLGPEIYDSTDPWGIKVA